MKVRTLTSAAPFSLWLALGMVTALGLGAALALNAYATSNWSALATGAAVAGVALFVLMTADWIEPLHVVLIAAALPAVYSTIELRIASAAPVTALAITAWFLRFAEGARPIRLNGIPRRSLVGVLSAVGLTTIAAQAPFVSARELINFVLLGVFCCLAADTLDDNMSSATRIAHLLTALAAICGILAVVEAVGIIPNQFPRWNTNFQRAALGFGQPNGLGLFFALSLPFAVFTVSINSRLPRLAMRCAAGAIVIGLAATFSRGSWISVLGGTLLFLWTGDTRLIRRVWLAAVLAFISIDVLSGGMMTNTVQRTVGDWVVEQRFALMQAGVLMFRAYPLLGVGPGGYSEMLDEFGPQVPQLWDYLPTPHNAFVQMAAETGILGLAAFIVLIGVSTRTAITAARANARASDRQALSRAVVWAHGILIWSCLFMWPFAHGTGQVVMLVFAFNSVLASRAGRA
jgi:O-antigen ligase